MDVVTLKKAVKDAGKYTDQEVSALEALFADSRIVEHGENENGEYWRWENGLVICRSANRVATRATSDALQWVIRWPYAGFRTLNVSVTLKSPIGSNYTSYTNREFSRLQWFISGQSYLHFIHPSGWAPDDYLEFHVIALGRLNQ